MVYTFDQIPAFEISRGFQARMFHTEQMTLALVEVADGAELPVHHHFHEQVSNLLEGSFEFVIDGEKRVLHAGDSLVIPGNVPHGGRALSKCVILDVFTPVREDFVSGRVAYAVR
ncbi:MAG: cupin domain-containing protein [Saprospiraceae bacterium]|nr:cupin domain-containing protein [Saprospiraceae bacterium]